MRLKLLACIYIFLISSAAFANTHCVGGQSTAGSGSWPPDCTTNLFPDAGSKYGLNWLGAYEHVYKSTDHISSASVFDADRMFVVSANGVVVTGRNPVNKILTPYAVYASDHSLPSNLDGAANSSFYSHKFFNSAVYGSYVYVATRYDPIYAFQVTGSGSRTSIQKKWMAATSRTFTENLQVVNGKLFAVHHADGVEVFGLTNPASPVSLATLKLTDSWSLAVRSDGNMLIADGAAGVQWVQYNDTTRTLTRLAGETLQTSPGVVFDVAFVNSTSALAAVAGGGVASYHFDPSDPDPSKRLLRLNTFALPGVCVDVEPMGSNQAAVACRTWVHIVTVDPVTGAVTIRASAKMHRRLGRQPYPDFPSTNLASHVTVSGDKVYVAAWDHLDMYQLVSNASTPDIRLSTHRVTFGKGAGSATVSVANGGTATLNITTVKQSSSRNITCSMNPMTLAPGATGTLTVSYDGFAPVQDLVGCSLRSNDLDDGSFSKSSVAVPVFADMPAYVDPGEVPPEFYGNAVQRDYTTGTVTSSWFDLADYLDPVRSGDQVLYFGIWASW